MCIFCVKNPSRINYLFKIGDTLPESGNVQRFAGSKLCDASELLLSTAQVSKKQPAHKGPAVKLFILQCCFLQYLTLLPY